MISRRPSSSGSRPRPATAPRAPLEHQRRLQRQLLNPLTANRATRRQRQLQETGARQQHRIQHRMIGKPRMGVEREPAREQPALTTRHLHRRTQQRVIRGPQPHATGIARTGPRRKPVTLALKRVTRQIHPPRAAAREKPTPVNRHTRTPTPPPGNPRTAPRRPPPAAASRPPRHASSRPHPQASAQSHQSAPDADSPQ